MTIDLHLRMLGRRLRAALTGRRWAFIVGCTNSGNTLLHRLLARHSQIATMKREGQFHTDQLPVPRELGLPRLWALSPELFALGTGDSGGVDPERLRCDWLQAMNDPRRRVLLDKTPVNVLRIPWLARHFEGATFIGMVRDGYAVAEGIRRRAGHPVALGARQWCLCNEALLDRFAPIDERRKLLVRYEELCRDPVGVLERLAALLGIDNRPIGSIARRPSVRVHGERGPIADRDAEAIGRLSPADLEVVTAEAGVMLRRLGYQRLPGVVAEQEVG